MVRLWVVTEATASDELGAGMGLKPPSETAGARAGWSTVKLCCWVKAESGSETSLGAARCLQL